MHALTGFLASPRARPLRHGLVLAGLMFLAWVLLVAAPAKGGFGLDAYAYWAVTLPHPYEVPVGALGAFPYSPPAAIVFSSFGVLSWHAFLTAWVGLLVGTAIWLGGRWALAVFAFPPVALELYAGNIHLLLAAAIALGFRHPAAWSFLLLTKVTPGIGLLWFVVRREWRPLWMALGAAAVLAGISFLVMPSLWPEWLAFLRSSLEAEPGGQSVPLPLWLRLPAAALVVVWGARTDRPWSVAVAATLALPVLWFTGFCVLLGMLPGLRAYRFRSSLNMSPMAAGADSLPLTRRVA